jgi:hypothetical protein
MAAGWAKADETQPELRQAEAAARAAPPRYLGLRPQRDLVIAAPTDRLFWESGCEIVLDGERTFRSEG